MLLAINGGLGHCDSPQNSLVIMLYEECSLEALSLELAAEPQTCQVVLPMGKLRFSQLYRTKQTYLIVPIRSQLSSYQGKPILLLTNHLYV